MPNPRAPITSRQAITSRAPITSRAAITSRSRVNGALPTQVSGLLAWYRGDLGITLNGSNVSSWEDQSGNGFTLVQGTANKQPAYTASSAIFNNLPCLRGNGVNNVLACLSNVWPTTNFTVISVIASVSGGATGEYFSCLQGGGNAALHFYGGSETEFKRASTGASKTLTSATKSIITYTGSGSGAGSIEKAYLNGGNVNTVSDLAPIISNRALYVFGADATPIFPRKYDNAEFMIFNRAISDNERVNLEYYLALRYAITLV